MTDHKGHRHIEITDAGHSVAAAEVEGLDGPGDIQASLHVEAGHLPVGSRGRLVDAVLDLPELEEGRHLHAGIPMGDGEMLDQVRERCDDVQIRAAGATLIVDADTRSG